MKTKLGVPQIPERWLPVVWGAIAVVIGVIIGPALYVLVSPGTSTIWDWLGSSKEQLLTIGTIALAIATYALFRKTADMADATRQMAAAAQQDSIRSDRQHQQTLSGQLGLNVPYFDITVLGADSTEIALRGVVRNVGAGPALNVKLRVSIKLPSFAIAIPYEHELGVIASGGKILLSEPDAPGDDVKRVAVTYVNQAPFTHTDIADSTIRLEWTTMFGSRGVVLYVVDESGHDFTSTQTGPEYVPLVPIAVVDQTVLGGGDRLA